jgi:hypothetical protein
LANGWTARGKSYIVYRIKMRKAISLTLGTENLLWLKGQAARTPRGSVSEVVDRLVAEARAHGWAETASVRSVAGTVDLPDDDPDLARADDYVRSLFAESARQPMVVRERRPKARGGRRG